MSQYDEEALEKVSTPPLVHDATLPDTADDDDAGAKTGVMVAVVGTPIDGGSIVFDAALGYCVWQAGSGGSTSYAWLYMTTIDETGATVLMTDDDGTPILTYAPVS